MVTAAYFLATMAPAVLPSFRELDSRPVSVSDPARAPVDSPATDGGDHD